MACEGIGPMTAAISAASLGICGRWGPEGRARFVQLFGHVQHADITELANGRWRALYLGGAECEIPACDARGPVLVFDHCHQHGWVRGVVCTGHNVRLGHIDAVRVISGALVDLRATQFGLHLDNCFSCAGTERRNACEDDALVSIRPPVTRTLLPGMLARPRGRAAHLRMSEQRTWCGISAEGLLPADNLPLCMICQRGTGRSLAA